MDEPDAPAYSYSRTKLARADSHPLKRGEIDAALRARPRLDVSSVSLTGRPAAEVERYFREMGWRGKLPVGPSDDWVGLASGAWHPPGDDFAFWRGRSLALTVYAVPSMHRAELHEVLLTRAIPALLEWAETIANGPQTGLTERRRFVAGTSNGDLRLAECQS
jgi:hypothetical protein